MAERFNLTAQLQLQAPTNVRQVVGDIRRQLSGLAVDVQVKGNTRALAQVNKQMQSVSKSAGSASKNVNNLRLIKYILLFDKICFGGKYYVKKTLYMYAYLE